MKFKITNTKIEGSIVVEAETIEELRRFAISECAKRNWDSEDCFSKEITNTKE